MSERKREGQMHKEQKERLRKALRQEDALRQPN